jgi:hypothetical protein
MVDHPAELGEGGGGARRRQYQRIGTTEGQEATSGEEVGELGHLDREHLALTRPAGGGGSGPGGASRCHEQSRSG